MTGSISRIFRIREVTMRTPSERGSAPPDRPVPEPRATNGTLAPAQARTTAATWLGRLRQDDQPRRRTGAR